MRTSIILNIIKNHVFHHKYDDAAASVPMQNYVIFHFKHFPIVDIIFGEVSCGDLELSKYSLTVFKHSFGNIHYEEDYVYKHLPVYFKKEYF